MNRRIRALATLGVLCGLVFALSACGGSSSSSSGSSGGTSTSSSTLKPALTGAGQTLTDGKKGGTLTVFQHEDFQHLDPGESYFSLDYDVIYATQMPLYIFPPNNSSTTVPDLASAPAQISSDGKTVTVHIRSNVHFSPPVNRAVTSADVAYAIERGANPDVANPYFPAYFFYIQGADKATGGPIPGISTPNPTTIVFHLTGPYGSFFAGALSLPLTAPVPKSYAAPLDAKKPTAYGSTSEVATGPYMIKADSTGKFIGIGYQPGKSLTLVRNPNWKPGNGPQPAYLNGININIGGDQNVIGPQVLKGSDMVDGDTPSATDVKLAYQHYYNQLIAVPGSGMFWVSMNNAKGPFANVNVRKALWAAMDREAMVKVNGGEIVGAVGTHFLYPGSLGFSQAGGFHGPNVDYNNYPEGNLTVAKKYMKLAYPSTNGVPPSSATIKVVGSTGDPAAPTAAIANHAVQALGFKTNFTLVDQPVMYGKYCGVPKSEIDICPNVGWIRDWSDPQTLLDPTFAGYNIVATNNSNWGQVSWQDYPKAAGGTYVSGPLTPIDQAMKAAEKAVGTTNRTNAWAKVDQMLVANAVAVPYLFGIQPNLKSADVRGINDLWNIGSWDYAYSSLDNP
jgi:peptide/nickel transport system substrate-binding protein